MFKNNNILKNKKMKKVDKIRKMHETNYEFLVNKLFNFHKML